MNIIIPLPNATSITPNPLVDDIEEGFLKTYGAMVWYNTLKRKNIYLIDIKVSLALKRKIFNKIS